MDQVPVVVWLCQRGCNDKSMARLEEHHVRHRSDVVLHRGRECHSLFQHGRGEFRLQRLDARLFVLRMAYSCLFRLVDKVLPAMTSQYSITIYLPAYIFIHVLIINLFSRSFLIFLIIFSSSDINLTY